MSEVGAFTVYCIELLKERKGITGAEAYDILRDRGFDYIKMTYPALHTMSEELIYDDLLGVVEAGRSTDGRSGWSPSRSSGS